MKTVLTISVFFAFLFLSLYSSSAQSVRISNDNSLPDSSAILDVKSTDKGMLVPRMTSAQRTGIATPATGLLVYDTDTQSFWYRNSTIWINLLTATTGGSLSGNVAGSTDFMGTTNNQSLVFKANNLQAGKIDLPLFNTFWGAGAGASNTTGVNNTATGTNALYSNLTTSYNTANGAYAYYSNISGAENTADGEHALYFNTTGYENTANGRGALYYNTTGDDNTANGYWALFTNTTGNNNTANGAYALESNSSGLNNTGNGVFALRTNTTGSYNSANGMHALSGNRTGNANTASGENALSHNYGGSNNTANGRYSLFYNYSGFSNVAIGANALYNNFARSNLVAIGDSALFNNEFVGVSQNIHATANTAVGSKALYSNTNGYYNTAIGFRALYSNTTGYKNSATGFRAIYSNTTGSYNTANGDSSLYANTIGSSNSATGSKSLISNTVGNNNTAMGYLADVTMNNLTNATALGYNAKVGASNSLVLGGNGAEAVKVGIGTQTPSTTLEVIGQVKITGGSPGMDKVLTSDASGLATWQAPAPPAGTEIAYIYNLTATTIAVEADIPFDSNGSITSGFTHTAGSTDIGVVDAGIYAVQFSVSGTEPNQFALFLNGSVVPGSIYGSGAGTQQNSGQAVFSISAGDVLTLRNHSSAAAVGLASVMGVHKRM